MNSQNDNDGTSDMNDSISNYINEAQHAADNESSSDESMEGFHNDLSLVDEDSDNDELVDDSTGDADEEPDEEEFDDEGDGSDDEDIDSDDLDFDEEDSEDDLDNDDESDLDDEDENESSGDESMDNEEEDDDDDTDIDSDDDDNVEEENSGLDDLDIGDEEDSDDLDNDDSDGESDNEGSSDDGDTEVNSSEENVIDEDVHEDSHVDEDIDEAGIDETHDVQEEVSGAMTDVKGDDDLHDDSDKAVLSEISEEEDVIVSDEVAENIESGVENNMQDIIAAAGSMEEPFKQQRSIKKKSVPKDVIKGINVDLTFETARQSIPLGELSTIKEGYTFVSPNPVNSLIDIRANGRLIGHGRLVNVDGRVGVQITEIL